MLGQIARHLPGMPCTDELQRGRGGRPRHATERGTAFFRLADEGALQDTGVAWGIVRDEERQRITRAFCRCSSYRVNGNDSQ